MGGVMQAHNSGQYIVYADHSHTGVGTSLNDSSASPRATMTMFRGQRIALASLRLAAAVRAPASGTAPRGQAVILRTAPARDPLDLLAPEVRRALPVSRPCEATFEWLADNSPRSLSNLIGSGLLRPADLTFAAEALGRSSDSALVRSTLVDLLCHESAVVREGAIYGLSNHLDDAVRALLQRIAAEDPSTAVRDVARDAYERA